MPAPPALVNAHRLTFIDEFFATCPLPFSTASADLTRSDILRRGSGAVFQGALGWRFLHQPQKVYPLGWVRRVLMKVYATHQTYRVL